MDVRVVMILGGIGCVNAAIQAGYAVPLLRSGLAATMPRDAVGGRAWRVVVTGGMAHALSLGLVGLQLHLSESWMALVLAAPSAVLGAMAWWATRRWWLGAALLFSGVAALVLGRVYNDWTHGGGYIRSEGVSIIRTLLVACGTFHVLALGSLVVWRHRASRARGAMAGVCRSCGYRVAGLAGGVCPECGSSLGIDR
ncbi:MAG: hypothetical protein AB7V21_03590 [Phycisphaerales bacterium]